MYRRLFWSSSGVPLEFSFFFGVLLEFFWRSSGVLLEFFWSSSGVLLELIWSSSGVLVFLEVSEVVLEISGVWTSVFSGSFWSFSGVFLECFWSSSGFSGLRRCLQFGWFEVVSNHWFVNGSGNHHWVLWASSLDMSNGSTIMAFCFEVWTCFIWIVHRHCATYA